MKFLLDHDVPDRVGALLGEAGHAVVMLRKALPVDSRDSEVLAYAASKGLILVTCNRDDFLELARNQRHVGIIVLIRRKSRIAECAALVRLLAKSGETGLVKNVNFA